MPQIISVLLKTVLSVVVMYLLSRLIGFRQISQLSLFDYINSITIGSLAADTCVAQGPDVWYYMMAMVLYGLFTFLFALVTDHSKRLRRVLVGSPYILMKEGKLYRKSFKHARLDLDEFLSECRLQGYFDVSELDTAVMEPNGKISILPKGIYKNVTLNDMNLKPESMGLSANVIMDGVVIEGNLKKAGKTAQWLENCLNKQGIYNTKEVFLATFDPAAGTLQVFLKLEYNDRLNVVK